MCASCTVSFYITKNKIKEGFAVLLGENNQSKIKINYMHTLWLNRTI